jgi:hypothetical protein
MLASLVEQQQQQQQPGASVAHQRYRPFLLYSGQSAMH